MREHLTEQLVNAGSSGSGFSQGTGGLEVPKAGSLPSVVRIEEVNKPGSDSEFAAHEFIATFEPGTSETRLRELLEKHDLWTIRDLSQDDGSPTVLLLVTEKHPRYGKSSGRLAESGGGGPAPDFISRSNTESAALHNSMSSLLAETEVANVSVNHLLETSLTPNDPHFPDQNWLNATANNPLTAESAWDITTGSPELSVAIIDSGVSFTHPDLDPRIAESRSQSFWTYKEPEVDPGDASCDGHGTKVAGVAAATGNDDLGVAGLDWQSEIVSLRVSEGDGATDDAGNPVPCDKFPDANVIDALNHVTDENTDGDSQTIEVVNMSLGCPGSDCFNSAFKQAAADAYNSGALLVGAAGNGGSDGIGDDNDEIPFYPASYPSVASTSALNTFFEKTDFSNYGDSVEYSGQGQFLLTDCYHPTPTHCAFPFDDSPKDGISNFSGTSAASPSAAGVALLGWSADLGLSNEDIRSLTHDTGVNINSDNPDYSGQLGRHVAAYRMVRTTNSNSLGEPNDSFSEATSLSPITHDWQLSEVWNHSSSDQFDWYSFEMEESENLAILTEWFNIDVNLDIKLYDADQNLLEEGVDTGESGESFTYKSPTDQTVYLRVRATDGGDGSGGPNGYNLFFKQIAPRIESLSTSAGRVFTEVTVNGVNFTESRQSDEAVRFADGADGWVDATSYESWGPEQITALIPNGAQNSQEGIQVRATLEDVVDQPLGSSNAEPFEIIPTIHSVDTSKEYTWGDQVVIDGIGFGLDRGSSSVEFQNQEYGNTVAGSDSQFVSWADDEITVLVPENSHDGPLRVLKSGLSSEASDPLTINLPAPPNLTGDQF